MHLIPPSLMIHQNLLDEEFEAPLFRHESPNANLVFFFTPTVQFNDLTKRGIKPRQSSLEKHNGGKNLKNGGTAMWFDDSPISFLRSLLSISGTPDLFSVAPDSFSGTPVSSSEIRKSFERAARSFLRTPISFWGPPLFSDLCPNSFFHEASPHQERDSPPTRPFPNPNLNKTKPNPQTPQQ